MQNEKETDDYEKRHRNIKNKAASKFRDSMYRNTDPFSHVTTV
jgi:hypothetical protein